MRLVFLGDIQGNLPALDAVLADVDRKPVDVIVHVGNVVGHGPFPTQVIARLRERGIAGVRGHLDDSIAGGLDPGAARRPSRRWRATRVTEAPDDAELVGATCRWTRQQLSDAEHDWLARLPFTVTVGSETMKVAVFHAHPVAIDMPLHDGLADDHFREVGAYTGADVNVFAHTRSAFWRVVDGRWYVNAGSVGSAAGSDSRPTYAVVELNGGASVRISRVDYDRKATAAAAREAGLPSGALRLLGVA